jgi:hypothetical protein
MNRSVKYGCLAIVGVGAAALIGLVVLVAIFGDRPSPKSTAKQEFGPPPISEEEAREELAANRAKAAAEAASEAAAKIQAVTVPAPDLIAAYQQNEIAADQRFKGETVVIRGDVNEIAKDILGTPYVTLSREGISAVPAMFPRSSAAPLADLRPGQTIVVQCRVEGKMMNVIGRDCELR